MRCLMAFLTICFSKWFDYIYKLAKFSHVLEYLRWAHPRIPLLLPSPRKFVPPIIIIFFTNNSHNNKTNKLPFCCCRCVARPPFFLLLFIYTVLCIYTLFVFTFNINTATSEPSIFTWSNLLGRMQVSLARNWKMVNDFVLTISNEEIFMKKG